MFNFRTVNHEWEFERECKRQGIDDTTKQILLAECRGCYADARQYIKRGYFIYESEEELIKQLSECDDLEPEEIQEIVKSTDRVTVNGKTYLIDILC